MPALRVAMIGYEFMGRAHSNAWRQAHHFFDLPIDLDILSLDCIAGRTLSFYERMLATLRLP